MAMPLALPLDKVVSIQNQCIQLLKCPNITILEITKLIGKLSFTTQAVVPARLQHRFLQNQQINCLKQTHSYQSVVVLNKESLGELKWWKENLFLQNGKPLSVKEPEIVIQTDASKQGWGAACQETSTRGSWSASEKMKHINVLELIAVKLAIQTFTKLRKVKAIHLQIDNMTALSYLLKIGGVTVWNF